MPFPRSFKSKNPIPVVPFEKCAAKTTPDNRAGTTVPEHCVYVGRVGEALFSLLPGCVKNKLPPEPGLPLSVHDVGKVSPGYELKYFEHSVVKAYAPELCGKKSFVDKHASISAAALDHWLGTAPLTSPVSIAAAAHHGTMDRGYPPDTADTLGGAAWADERRKLIEHLSDVFGGSLQDAEHANPALLAGLTCVSDWIGSDEQFYPADRPPVIEGDPALTARHAISACGFTPATLKPGLSFEQIFGFAPHASQEQFIASASRPGLYVLEAPMGIGKTEAALFVAYRLMEAGHHHGFYFALPTRLTSDRIHSRVSEFLLRITDAPTAPRLAHGMAWLHDCQWKHEDEDEKKNLVHSWFNPMKRALLYPYSVGTIDQALLSVLNVKHSFVRLFGLAGKVVILDEVHSYDMYTGTLLDELVARLQSVGCTVIILSATLTGQRRSRLAPALGTYELTAAYPLMTGLPSEGGPFAHPLPAPAAKTCRTRLEPWGTARVADEAVAAARRGQCVVCIANTVARAQAWYRAVKTAMPDNAFPVGILHARFPLFLRGEIETEWMDTLGKEPTARPKGCVLVATQILEQSVDIDADWMISELAPTDMLLQRMGRLWRHPREQRPCAEPEMVIVTQDPSSSQTTDEAVQALGKENCCVYAPYVLLRTHAVWSPLQNIQLPGDIRTLIEATYAEQEHVRQSIMWEFKRQLDQRCERLSKLACSAQDNVRGIPTGEDDEKAATRYSDLPTCSVLLVAEVQEASAWGDQARVSLLDGTVWDLRQQVPNFNATRALHASTVSIARHLLPERGNVRQSCRWLDRHFFDKPVVLVCGADGLLVCFKGPETALRYSPEYGIWRSDQPQEVWTAREPSDSQSEDGAYDSSQHDW